MKTSKSLAAAFSLALSSAFVASVAVAATGDYSASGVRDTVSAPAKPKVKAKKHRTHRVAPSTGPETPRDTLPIDTVGIPEVPVIPAPTPSSPPSPVPDQAPTPGTSPIPWGR